MTWRFAYPDAAKRVALFASRHDHCVLDLLWRWRSGELGCDVAGVVSNHEDFRREVEREGLPFHYVPVNAANKPAAFAEMERIWEDAGADLVVLARYMQIVPPDLCERWPGRIMNIHHSFLPSFMGANPYQRAWERGVKLGRGGDLSASGLDASLAVHLGGSAWATRRSRPPCGAFPTDRSAAASSRSATAGAAAPRPTRVRAGTRLNSVRWSSG